MRDAAAGSLIWKLVLLLPPAGAQDTASEWLRAKLSSSRQAPLLLLIRAGGHQCPAVASFCPGAALMAVLASQLLAVGGGLGGSESNVRLVTRREVAADLSRELLSSEATFFVPADGSAGATADRHLSTAVRDASPALAGPAGELHAAAAGAAAVLLHVAQGEQPAAAHRRLHALLSALGDGCPGAPPAHLMHIMGIGSTAWLSNLQPIVRNVQHVPHMTRGKTRGFALTLPPLMSMPSCYLFAANLSSRWGCLAQVPLLVLSSDAAVPAADLAAWMGNLLAGDGALASRVSAHRILAQVAPASPEADAQLSAGLTWLAQHAPPAALAPGVYPACG